jgi:Protein of unknown function (DUF4242)
VLYLAEFYLPGGARRAEVAARAQAAADHAEGAAGAIRFVQAIFVPQDETCFALYQAESESDVAAAGATAGLIFDRIVTAFSLP